MGVVDNLIPGVDHVNVGHSHVDIAIEREPDDSLPPPGVGVGKLEYPWPVIVSIVHLSILYESFQKFIDPASSNIIRCWQSPLELKKHPHQKSPKS